MPQILTAIIAAFSALLAPIIAWWLSNRGKASHAKDIELLLKRLELVERTAAVVDKSCSNQGVANEIVQLEIEAVLESIRNRNIKQVLIGTLEIKRLNPLQRFFLNFSLSTITATVYRVAFYIFLVITFLGGLTSILFALYKGRTFDMFYLEGLVGGMVLYFGISLLFRAAAVRSHLKTLNKKGLNGT
jgi:hypothetical protein